YFPTRRLGIFSPKYPANVYHGVSQNTVGASRWTHLYEVETPFAPRRRRRRAFGMTEKPTRIEKDSMGQMTVPSDALHGASTHRAVLNFPVSGYRFPRPFIRALGLVKWAAAQENHDLGLLDSEREVLNVQADVGVSEGKLDEHF